MTYALALGNPSIQTWSHFSKNNILKSISDYAQFFLRAHAGPSIADLHMLFKILKKYIIPN